MNKLLSLRLGLLFHVCALQHQMMNEHWKILIKLWRCIKKMHRKSMSNRLRCFCTVIKFTELRALDIITLFNVDQCHTLAFGRYSIARVKRTSSHSFPLNLYIENAIKINVIIFCLVRWLFCFYLYFLFERHNHVLMTYRFIVFGYSMIFSFKMNGIDSHSDRKKRYVFSNAMNRRHRCKQF